mgnify:CR=1 FL=1
MARAFHITDSAAKRIAELRAAEGDDGLMLRIIVDAGGCNGFQYRFDFDRSVKDDDAVYEHDGVKVVVDEVSLDFLENAQVDYKRELIGSYFTVENPNASSSCGCGTSFSVD